MRSSRSDPGDPWPQDMVLRVDEPWALTTLLFVREAWRLPIDEVPALDAVPDVGTTERHADGDPSEVVELWRREWARAWARQAPIGRAVRAPDAETARLLRETSDEDLADATRGETLFRSDGVDHEAFSAWHDSLHDDRGRPLGEEPERVSVAALVTAWQSGLESIVQLPYAGYFAARIHPSTLVVSRTARHDPGMYRRALATPVTGAGRAP